MTDARNEAERETHPAPEEGRDRFQDVRREVDELLDVMYEKRGVEHHAVSRHIAKECTPPSDLGATGSAFELGLERTNPTYESCLLTARIPLCPNAIRATQIPVASP